MSDSENDFAMMSDGSDGSDFQVAKPKAVKGKGKAAAEPKAKVSVESLLF